QVRVRSLPGGGAFRDIAIVRIEFERFRALAGLSDELLHAGWRKGDGTGLAGRPNFYAGAVLKDVPAIGAKTAGVPQGGAECGAPGAQSQMDSAFCRRFRRRPNAWMND